MPLKNKGKLMAATSSITNLSGSLPPVKNIPVSKFQKRWDEYIKYASADPSIPYRAPLRIEMLNDDYETFKKRFEKIPEGFNIIGPIQYAKYYVIFITVAGITYVMIKVYRTATAKL